jgi:polysaccharide biosynthesis/export protein
MFSSQITKALGVVVLAAAAAVAQQTGKTASAPAPQQNGKAANADASYVLGPGDEITIWVRDLEEVGRKPVRIENDGFVSIPLAGRVEASGLTAPQLEAALERRLKAQILEPQVSVGIVEFRSQPVSVIGAVNRPGVLQVQGRKTLVEVLSMAEGLRPDAGRVITVTRRVERGEIPIPGAALDGTGRYSVAKIDLKSGLLDGVNPEQNIAIQPGDVIAVPKADMIFVIGEVHRQGGFALNDRETLSVLQALALAEGLGRTAAAKDAKILRTQVGQEKRVEIPIDLKKVLEGKGEDLRLQPSDILFVPNNATKNAALRGLETALQIGTGLAVYRR